MKNELPELTPKPDSWDKIMQQAEFESQLANHFSRLPQYSPNEETWRKITGKMDRKKTVPIWIKWSVAASILGFILVTALTLNRFYKEGEIKNQEILTGGIDTQVETVNPEVKVSEPAQSLSPKEAQTQNTLEELPERIIAESNVEMIELPKIGLPEMDLNYQEKIGLSLPEIHLTEPRQTKTIHQVSISWSKLKPGLHIKTPFDRKELDQSNQTQASSQLSKHIIIEIDN